MGTTEREKKWLWAAYMPIAVLYLEGVFKLFRVGSVNFSGAVLTALFSLAAGLLISTLSSLGSPRFFRVFSSLLLAAVTLLFCVQTVYREIFQEYLGLGLVSVGGAAIATYWRETLSGIARSAAPLILSLAPLVLWLLFGKKLLPERITAKNRLILAALFLALQCAASFGVRAWGGGGVSPAFTYGDGFTLPSGVRQFGLITAQRLDAQLLLLPDSAAPSRPDPSPTPAQVPAETAPPVSAERDAHVLDIDFASLIESEQSPAVKEMHEFFSNREPTYENEYTGMFEGKNLIWIVAESFSPWAVDEELTPTLYKLSNSGFVFDEFYCPVTSGSTTGGEFITLTGLMQNSNERLLWVAGANNFMPFCMSNVLNAQGYASFAYHGGQYTYYDRDDILPALGYDYRANGVGLTLDEPLLGPTSDLDVVRNSVGDYIGEEPFNIYYMTISGHMDYNFGGGQDMCSRYEERVQGLSGYTEKAKAYVACNIDFDLSMEFLLKALEDAGILEDTVIVISPDHYPYGLKDKDLESMSDHAVNDDFTRERSTLIIWSGCMEKPIHIQKPCSSMDILPTLLNLFGAEYDSRLLMGRDILSDSPGFVPFMSYCFISEYGRYDSASNVFTPAADAGDISDTYVSDTVELIRRMYRYSADIAHFDYYSLVLPQK